LISLAFSEKL